MASPPAPVPQPVRQGTKQVQFRGEIWRLGQQPVYPPGVVGDGEQPLSLHRAVLYRTTMDGSVLATINLQPTDQPTGSPVRIVASEHSIWVDITLPKGAQRLRIDPNSNLITNRSDLELDRVFGWS